MAIFFPPSSQSGILDVPPPSFVDDSELLSLRFPSLSLAKSVPSHTPGQIIPSCWFCRAIGRPPSLLNAGLALSFVFSLNRKVFSSPCEALFSLNSAPEEHPCADLFRRGEFISVRRGDSPLPPLEIFPYCFFLPFLSYRIFSFSFFRAGPTLEWR